MYNGNIYLSGNPKNSMTGTTFQCQCHTTYGVNNLSKTVLMHNRKLRDLLEKSSYLFAISAGKVTCVCSRYFSVDFWVTELHALRSSTLLLLIRLRGDMDSTLASSFLGAGSIPPQDQGWV